MPTLVDPSANNSAMAAKGHRTSARLAARYREDHRHRGGHPSQLLAPIPHRALVDEARGKSKSQIEELLARWFPKPDGPPR